MTKQEIFDGRSSDDINKEEHFSLYLAKLAVDYYGSAIRDNRITEIVELGSEIYRGDY